MPIVNRGIDRALLVLRLAVATSFIVHGWMKLFGMGLANVGAFFESLGIPMAGVAAWGVSLLEFGGGIMLAMGIITRPLAILFMFEMLVAITLAVFPRGFVGGWELEFLLASASLCLALGGGGAYSVDAWLDARRFTGTRTR
jgi:putative oxidoreductase